MTGLIENMFIMPLLVGLVFVITSIITHRFPPGKINYLYGYRTNRSMKSQDRWDFAQKYSSRRMHEAGLALIAVSFTGFALPLSAEVKFWLGILPAILSCVYIFNKTEKALRQHFPESES